MEAISQHRQSQRQDTHREAEWEPDTPPVTKPESLSNEGLMIVLVPEEMLGPTLLAFSTGVASFREFCPPLSEIRRTDPHIDRETTADVRMGEAAGAALIIGMGAIASMLVNAPYPLVVSILTAAGLIALYEWTLSGRRFSNVRIVNV